MEQTYYVGLPPKHRMLGARGGYYEPQVALGSPLVRDGNMVVLFKIMTIAHCFNIL